VNYVAPIFLYTSWRTGGTALAAAFKNLDSAMLFYDPLNPILESLDSSQEVNSSSWTSNHPSGFTYFEQYLPLFKNGKIAQFPNLTNFTFRNSSKHFQAELVTYIQSLVDLATSDGRVAVFKFEQLEGHVSILRSSFPESLHLGVARNPELQYESWLEQLALGNSHFFRSAQDLIEGDLEFFKPKFQMESPNPNEIFQTYLDGVKKLRKDLDFTLELEKDSFGELLKFVTNSKHRDILKSAFSQYEKIESPPSAQFKFVRMQKRSLDLTSERDQVAADRDRIVWERDQISRERDRITNELTSQRDQISLKLTSERDQIAGERDRIAGERDQISGERDRIAGERDQIAGERDRIAGERDQVSLKLTSERDQISGERDRIAGERDQISSERDQVAADRDRITKELTSERDQVAADRDRITKELTSERDQVAADRDRITKELTSERDQVAADRDRITGERDDLLNSTIWRATKPIRWFANLFKR
jgi:hypothetical protein